MATETNRAALLREAKATPFTITAVPMPTISPTQVGIRLRAAAINPLDALLQSTGLMIQSYPFTLGLDGAGEVYAVGSAVTRFKPGDRVLALFTPMGEQRNNSASFMHYAAAEEVVVVKIPDHVRFEEAAVLPLAVATASAGMYEDDGLGLPLPSLEPKITGRVALVWGGSSSVGSAAVQLFRASGYEVAAVAGKANEQFVRDLGAKYVFDYRSDTVVEEVLAALDGKEFGGAFDAIGQEPGLLACAEIASKLGGLTTVATVVSPRRPLPQGLAEGVKVKKIFGTTIMQNAVGPAVFGQYLPAALAAGRFKCKPEPLIFGHGLGALQGAVDRLRAGVSAQKVVVQLP